MNKRNKQSEITRQKLLDAFWDIHREKPIKKITVREIAERAGINRCTFYDYYKDAYDILEQEEEEILNALMGEKIQRVSSLFNLRHYSEDLLSISEFCKNHHQSLSVLLSEKGDPCFSSRLWDIIWQNLRHNIGSLAKDPEDPMLDYLTEYITACHAGMIMLWLKNNCNIPFEQISNLCYSVMMNGIPPFLNDDNPYDKIADYILMRIKDKL